MNNIFRWNTDVRLKFLRFPWILLYAAAFWQVVGHRRCPYLLQMTKNVPFLTETRCKDVFSEWFLAIFRRFVQGASRKIAFCLWGPGKRAFSMVFLPNDSFSGLSFSVFFWCVGHFRPPKRGFWAPKVPKSVKNDQKTSVFGRNLAQRPFSEWF